MKSGVLLQFVSVCAVLPAVFSHAVITAVQGANGASVLGFGVTDTVPRNCTQEQPCQLDTPVLKDLITDPCGATLLSGSVNIQESLKTAVQQGGGTLPTLQADGTIEITLHQVNADGGGPFVAMVNTDATGKTWVPITVTQQVPGANGLIRGGPADSQLIVQLDDANACTGGDTGNVCLIRLNNGGEGLENSLANGAGPFGGCVAVMNANGAASTGDSTANTGTGNVRGNGHGRANNRIRRFAGNSFHVRDVVPSLSRRQQNLSSLLAQRRSLDQQIQNESRELAKRQQLTADLLTDIKTVLGTSVSIPIDGFAGKVDSDPNGGNSTTAFNQKNAVITTQQAVDLTKAVKAAIEAGLAAVAGDPNISLDAAGFNVTNKLDLVAIDQANQEADAKLKSGEIKSINAGNAGVSDANTAVLDNLLQGIADIRTVTVSATLLNAFTPGAAATPTAAPGNDNNGNPAATLTSAARGPVKTGGINTNIGNDRGRGRHVRSRIMRSIL